MIATERRFWTTFEGRSVSISKSSKSFAFLPGEAILRVVTFDEVLKVFILNGGVE